MNSRTLQYVGVTRYPRSDAVQVEIVHQFPTRAHEKLGEVVVNASVDPGPPVEKIEAALRRDAAKLGADAVVLVHDQTHPVGAVVTGPWWSSTFSTIHGRVVVGVAIKYK